MFRYTSSVNLCTRPSSITLKDLLPDFDLKFDFEIRFFDREWDSVEIPNCTELAT